VPRDTFLVLEDRVTLPRLYETWHTGKIYTVQTMLRSTSLPTYSPATRTRRAAFLDRVAFVNSGLKVDRINGGKVDTFTWRGESLLR